MRDLEAWRPLLKPWYRVVRDERRLLLEHGDSLLVFEGAAATRLLPLLLPLLDGTRTVGDVVGVLGEAAREPVEQAVRMLDERGLLTAAPVPAAEHPLVRSTAELFASVGSGAPGAVRDALAGAEVAVAGAAPVADELARLLRLSGTGSVSRIGLDPRSASASLTVVAPSPDERGSLSAWNERALADGGVWLQLLPFDGRLSAIGPLYVPGETACHECYRLRRLSNAGWSAAEAAVLEREPPRAPAPPFLVALEASVAAAVVLGWLADANPFLPGVVHALEWGRTPLLTRHVVYRVPRCRACSDAARLSPPNPFHEEALHAVS
jgi:bacteriocin biosynthesis cyclodehydratase domain-containing protein